MMKKDNFTGLRWQEDITTLLQAFIWDMRITVQTKYGYYTGEKAFIRDTILELKSVANW